MIIRLVLAEDQHLVRGALAALLGLEPDLEVVGEVARGDEVVEAVLRLRPDVLLLDVEMPGLDGLAAASTLSTESPGTRVLVLTTFGRPGYLRRAMEAGGGRPVASGDEHVPPNGSSTRCWRPRRGSRPGRHRRGARRARPRRDARLVIAAES